MGLHIGYKCKCQQNLAPAQPEWLADPSKTKGTSIWLRPALSFEDAGRGARLHSYDTEQEVFNM